MEARKRVEPLIESIIHCEAREHVGNGQKDNVALWAFCASACSLERLHKGVHQNVVCAPCDWNHKLNMLWKKVVRQRRISSLRSHPLCMN